MIDSELILKHQTEKYMYTAINDLCINYDFKVDQASVDWIITFLNDLVHKINTIILYKRKTNNSLEYIQSLDSINVETFENYDKKIDYTINEIYNRLTVLFMVSFDKFVHESGINDLKKTTRLRKISLIIKDINEILSNCESMCLVCST